jgi:hypothetical protein
VCGSAALVACVCDYKYQISLKSTGSNSESTTTKPKPQNRIRNDQQPLNHSQVHKAQRAKHKATKADKHKHHATGRNIHKQAQGKTLIPITDLSSGAALAKGIPKAYVPCLQKLFRYISGENDQQQKIDMTAPVRVLVHPSDGPFCKSNFTISFFVPFSLQVCTSKTCHTACLPAEIHQ